MKYLRRPACPVSTRRPSFSALPKAVASFMALALGGLPLTAQADTKIWLGTDNLWDNPANWSLTGEPTLLSDVIFPNPHPGTGEVLLTAGETAGSLTFSDFYVLTGGSLNLGSGFVTVAPNVSVRIESALTGSGGLWLSATNALGGGDNQIGGGALTLASANSYTGGTTIESGILRFDRDSQLGAAGTGINLDGGILSGAYSYLGARTVTVTGTDSQIHIARNATTGFSTYDAIFAGAAGTTLTKTGNGSLFLRGASTFAGDLVIDFNAGWAGQHIPANFAGTQLRDNGSFANIASLTIGQSSTLSLENNAGLAIAGVDRINDSAAIFLKGGTLHFHTKDTQTNTETIGTTKLVSGMSGLTAQSQGGGSAARLVVTDLQRDTGATVVLQGYQLGGTGGDNGRIFINEAGGGPTLNDGLIGGWALAFNALNNGPAGIEFATYKVGQGVGNLGNTAANYGFIGYSANAVTAAGAADNVRVAATVAGVTTRTINSLTLGSAALTATIADANVLTIDTGGILNQNVVSTITGGDVTSGGNEVFVHTTGTSTLTLNSRITGNLALVKDLSGTLTLNGPESNTYTGGTFINNGSIATSVTGTATLPVGGGSTVTTGSVDGRTYLGTGAVRVDQAILTMGGTGATSFVGSEAAPTYTALNMAQINLPGGKSFASTEVFSMGAGTVISAPATADQGLNSLTRGTNVFLATDAIVAHSTFLNGQIGTGSNTVQNLGAEADLFYGLSGNANAGSSQLLAVGQGTAWKGISTDRSSRTFEQGTINADGDFYLQGLMVPGANATLTLGGTGSGTYSIVNSTAGNTPINAFLIGNVTLNENSAVALPSNLTFVATPGSMFLLSQANSLGSNVDPASNAKILLQAGSTLNLSGTNATPYLNGNATFEAGARFWADDNQAATLAGSGTMTFLPGSIIDITQVNALTGTQPIVTSPGTIVRLNQSNINGISTRIGSDAVFQVTSANRTLTSQTIPENLTISGGVVTNGGLGNTSPTSYNVDAGYGKLIIGPGGATFAATTNTTLGVNDNFDLQGNTLTIGSTDSFDGNPKRGIVSLGSGGSTSTADGVINVLSGFQLTAAGQNVLPDQATLNLESGATLFLGVSDFIETVGALTGSGSVVTNQGGTIPGSNLRVGANNSNFTFAGAFLNGATTNNVALTKMGTGTMDLTGVSTATNRMSVDQGTLRLRDGGQTAFVVNNVNRGGTLTLDNAIGTSLDNRLGGVGKDVTLAGGTLNLIGSPTAAVSEAIRTFIANGGGQGTINITPGAGGSTIFNSTTFGGRSISTFLLRGEKLGATPGAGVATFTAATPNLFGTVVPNNNTTTTQALRPDILSDTPTTGGIGALGFVTLDNATNGFRMLTAAEYANTTVPFSNTNLNLSLTAPLSMANPAFAGPLDTQVQSLVLNSGSSVTNTAVPTTNGAQSRFVIKSGGVLVPAGVTTSITSPYLDQAGAYYFHTYGDLSLNTVLLGNPGFVKTGPGTLEIGAGGVKFLQNTGAGMFIGINEGTVNLGPDNSFGTAIGSTVNASDLYLAGGTLNLNGNSQTFRIFTSENTTNANLLPGTGGNLTNTGAPIKLAAFGGGGGNGTTGMISNNLFTGTMTGAIDFEKVSASGLGFNNLSTFTGSLTLRGGTTQLRDLGQFTGITSLNASYSTLLLDSQYGLTNVNNRIPNIPVVLRGSSLEVRGFPGENTSQQLQTVTLPDGTSLLVSHAQGAGSADLIIGDLVRSANVGVRFNGNNLGRYAPAGTMNQDSRIILTQLNGATPPSYDSTQPATISNGFLGGWAVVQDGDFAAYRIPSVDPLPANAVTGGGVSFYGNTGAGYPAYTSGTTSVNFVSGNIVDVSADTTLTAGDKTVGALRLSGGALRQLFFGSATDTLNIESGGFVRSNNNNGFNLGSLAVPGRLTAGGMASTGTAELYLHVHQNSGNNNIINSVIIDNPNGANVALIKDLNGQVDLTGANTYTGGTFVNGGTLRLNTAAANANSVVAIPGPLAINNGTVTLATQGQIKNTATVTINGGGILNLSNNASDDLRIAGLTFNNPGGGTPQVTSPSATAAGTVTKLTVLGNISSMNDTIGSTPTIQGTITNTQVQLDFGDNTTTRIIDVGGTSPIGLIINAPILNGKLLKTGPGMLVLGQPSGTGAVSSTFSGGLQVDGGAVRIDNQNALSTNANVVTIGSGAALVVNTGTAIPSTVSLELNSATLSPMANVILAGPVNVTGASTIAVNDLNVATTARNVTINGALTGSGSINVPASPVNTQNGTLLLSNTANSYSGSISLQPAAILTAQSSTGFGSTLGAASVAMAGGTLNIRDNGEAGSSTLVYGTNLTVTGNSVLSVDRPSANSNNTVQFGSLNLNNAALTVTGGNGYTVSFASPATLTGTATVNNSTTVTVPQLTGSGSLVKSNTGTLNTTTSSSYTGSTTVSAGTLRMAPTGGGTGLGDGPLLIAGGATLTSDPSSGTVTYAASTVKNNGTLRVQTGVADFGTSFIETDVALTGAQPFSDFTEMYFRPSDLGLVNFQTASASDAVITLENSNSFLNPQPGPGQAGTGVFGGTAINFNQNDLVTRSGGYFGTTEQGALYRGAITIGGNVPAGPVTFGTSSDDGSVLYVDLNGDHVFTSDERIVNNYGLHGTVAQIGTVNLGAGTYDVAIALYNATGGGVIQGTFASGANVAFGSHYTITPGGSLGATSQIQIEANSQLIAGGLATGTLRLNSNSILTLAGVATPTASLATTLVATSNSTMNLSENHTLTVDNLNGSASGTIVKSGTGALIVSNTHLLGGGSLVRVDEGSVFINSVAGPGSSGSFTVNASGILGGTGDLGLANVTVNADGSISPGNSPGTLAVGGNVTLNPNANFLVEIGGATPGDGSGFYDQLLVGGNASFEQAELNISTFGGYLPQTSDIFYILIAGGTAFGEFAGLPEGALFTSSEGLTGLITYQANWTGDQASSTLTGGNDVALHSMIPEPGTFSLLLTGLLGFSTRRRRTQRA